MAKVKAVMSDPEEDDAWIPGKLYQIFVPGGFTMAGWYVKPLGLGQHRFRNVRHMRNAGQVELPEMCRSGKGASTWTESSWVYYDTTPFGKAPWDGPVPEEWKATL